jgi:hypothetical protein
MGRPEGRLKWLLGDTVIATGGYNMKELELPADKIPQTVGDLLAVCQLEWIEPSNITVTELITRKCVRVTLTK